MFKDPITFANDKYMHNLEKEPEKTVLRLFITGATPRSCRAVVNLKNICTENLEGFYELEVVDIYQHPEIAQKEHIIASPTLIKKHPLPRQLMVGDLSDQDRVKRCLGIIS